MHAKLLPIKLLCAWDSPGKNTGVGCHALPPGDLSYLGIEPTPLYASRIGSRILYR